MRLRIDVDPPTANAGTAGDAVAVKIDGLSINGTDSP
jgi:hypothetical protein